MDKDKLVEVWSKSNVEEIIGLLWAILASIASSRWVSIPAAIMAVISIGAAIYYAAAALRSHAQKEAP